MIGKQQADLAYAFEDMGQTLQFLDADGAMHRGHGTVNVADRDAILPDGSTVVAHEIEVTYSTSTMPGLVQPATLTVDGVEYRVVMSRQLDDGEMTQVWCARKE